ncbi:CBS domain-containing protein [Desulfovibrionales bacterium]
MLKVKEIMTRDVFTINRTDTLHTARFMMSLARIRHIPVVEGEGFFIGLLTHRDILSASISKFADVDKNVQDEIDAGIPVNKIMRTDVKTVGQDSPLREVAVILLQHKYGCLPVVDHGKLKGIVTEADFLKLTIRLLENMDHISMR